MSLNLSSNADSRISKKDTDPPPEEEDDDEEEEAEELLVVGARSIGVSLLLTSSFTDRSKLAVENT